MKISRLLAILSLVPVLALGLISPASADLIVPTPADVAMDVLRTPVIWICAALIIVAILLILLLRKKK